MTNSPEAKNCTDCSREFKISPDEKAMYEKVGIDPSGLCFECRLKQHLAFWSFGKFRKGVSDLAGERLITTLPEKTRYPIYTRQEWYGDQWDPMTFGQDYNPDRLFFEQIQELQEKVPRPHQMSGKSTNCDWSDDVWNSKNCYLSRSLESGEDLFYAYRCVHCRNSVDLTYCYETENSYDCRYCSRSHNIICSVNSRDCINCTFVFDCRNCQNCFMCWNLRGRSYCIENFQYSREEYKARLAKLWTGSYKELLNLQTRFEEILRDKAIHRENFNLKITNSVGNYLMTDRQCINCFHLEDSEECYNCVRGLKDRSMIDSNGCWFAEMMGNCAHCVNAYGLKYCLWSPSRFSEYLDLCEECDSCFGCIGLRKKRYCILNKQYSEKDFVILKDRIITDMKKRGEYGKFFPYSMGVIPFNFSTSMLYFPQTKAEEILSKGGYWYEPNESHIEGMPSGQLADRIQDVKDEIATQALICPTTGWRFNIAADELAFYRSKNIPLPREHFDVRTKNRIRYLTVIKPYPHKCVYCQKDIMAYYPPEWGYKKIACLECYQREIA